MKYCYILSFLFIISCSGSEVKTFSGDKDMLNNKVKSSDSLFEELDNETK